MLLNVTKSSDACKKYIGKDGRNQIVSRLQVRPHAWPCPHGSRTRLTCALMTPYCKLMTSSLNLWGAFQPFLMQSTYGKGSLTKDG